MERLLEWADKFLAWLPFIILAALAGAANNTYQTVVKKRAFSVAMFFVSMGLAGFLGLVLAVTPLQPWLEPFRESIACVVGFCVFPIMRIIEEEVPALLRRWFRRADADTQAPRDPEN